MWFIFAVVTALSWGGADLFYKKGSDSEDKLSHWKIVVMVGLVMGIHAFSYMILKGIQFDPYDMVRYIPVSSMYILSMTIGYIGLRYLELSIASPVQNSSGAITAILLAIFFQQDLNVFDISGIVLVTIGVVGLGILERKAEVEALRLNRTNIPKKYQLSVMAITFPLLYAFFDSLGTFLDGIYLDELELISEDAALLAYEFTFLIVGIIAYIYIKFVKKEDFKIFQQKDRGLAAILETTGQFFYVYAMAGKAIITAPLVASYSIFSVILSRIFLKEKLSKEQYLVIGIVMLGIALLGIVDAI